MRISSVFPSDYLRAADLGGREALVTMNDVQVREFAGDPKPVLYFQGKQRGLVLNKTNANVIMEAYGEETESWAGKPVILYEAIVEFQGKRVPAVRVRIPNGRGEVGARPAQSTPPPASAQSPTDALDDEIPF